MSEEKYFVFYEKDGDVKWVYWCVTEEEAREYAKKTKKEFPKEADTLYIGQLLT